ncbi:cytochrome P450 [Streptacidiphilus sp. P02-A3a]|uniref:cytochrome P450 n=1 Tax=Streptacidiphilus sp. P02-A3a TaxID=2704468 RepID=UPI0015FBC1C2|nr:cytochrome P450 [Streptacidiphilus sp. P02-A3a]QMU71406.1 cytochrome P450 [Streptacidiphilus sp. P02-A3a]
MDTSTELSSQERLQTRSDETVPAYPMDRAPRCPFDPAPELRSLDEGGPLNRVRLWDRSTPWLVTGYAEQRQLLADPRVSADTKNPGYPHPTPATRARREQARTFLSMDDPEHARMRRMVTGSFAIKRVEAMRPAIQQIVDNLIDQLLDGPRPVDLVQAFALPVPSLVICELLGVPYADHAFFQRNSSTLVNSGSSAEAGLEAQSNLVEYLNDLIGRKLASPADDLLSLLAAEQVATGALTQRELAVTSVLLLIAGHETTANMIALGTVALLEHPEQLADLRGTDDPAFVAGAVEELLRYLNITHFGRRRVALTDIPVGGHTIRAGEGIVLANEVGNRDQEVFPDPDRLDLHRDARRHVAFGFGPHQCLGQPLARVELQVAYRTLYRRIPDLRLAVALEDVRFKHDGLVYGVYELPVTW